MKGWGGRMLTASDVAHFAPLRIIGGERSGGRPARVAASRQSQASSRLVDGPPKVPPVEFSWKKVKRKNAVKY